MFPKAARARAFGPNHLRLELADPPSISLALLGKRPGAKMLLEEEQLDFSVGGTPEGQQILEAYERLIHDAMIGDRTLFTSADGIERLWEIATPLLDNPPPVRPYEPGSWGPPEVDELIAPGCWILGDSAAK